MSGKPPKVLAIPSRLAIVGLLFLGGFKWPLLFPVAGFLAWSIYTDLRNPRPKPTEWFELRWTTTGADPNWKEYFLQFCESPAERAFLEAMVAEFALLPEEGLLRGPGLSLDIQVHEPPYRLDFLANEWLVIEIDGATYHSSEDAIAKDARRDALLLARGLTTLRIPAKVVFSEPGEAVNRVRARLSTGHQANVDVQSKQLSLKNVAASVVSFCEGVGQFVEELDRHVTVFKAVREACSAPTLAYDIERKLISSVVEAAQSKIAVEDYCAGDEERKRRFDEAAARIRKAIEAQSPRALEPPARIEVPEFTAPPSHEDPEINEQIQRTYGNLQESRTKFLSEVRQRLRAEPRLQEHVRAKLNALSCGTCWEAIRPIEPHLVFSLKNGAETPGSDGTDAELVLDSSSRFKGRSQSKQKAPKSFASYREALEWARDRPGRAIIRAPASGKWEEAGPSRSRQKNSNQ